jgi:hypothetical protein
MARKKSIKARVVDLEEFEPVRALIAPKNQCCNCGERLTVPHGLLLAGGHARQAF